MDIYLNLSLSSVCGACVQHQTFSQRNDRQDLLLEMRQVRLTSLGAPSIIVVSFLSA